jgi:hypothetical protein
MSTLAAGELLKHDYRIAAFLLKYKKGAEFEIVGGKKVKFIYDKDIAAAVEKKNSKVISASFLIATNKKDRYKFSDLKKTDEFKPVSKDPKKTETGTKVPPLGYVAEGVVMASMLARFIKKAQAINDADVIAMIKEIKLAKDSGNQKSVLKKVTIKSANKNPKLFDTIIAEVGLAKDYYNFLVNPESLKILKPYISGAVTFSNSITVRKWADLFYENNQENKIVIKGTGISGQSETKADVEVYAGLIKDTDLHKINLDLSIKSNDTKQFGQVSGSEFEKQLYLWDSLLSVSVKQKEKEYNKFAAQAKHDEAITLAYKFAAAEFNKLAKPLKIKNVVDGLIFHSTKGRETTTISLSKIGSSLYKPSELKMRFANYKAKEITADVWMGVDKNDPTKKLPRLVIYVDGEKLLQVRNGSTAKANGERYVRNYIEGESLYFSIIHEDFK